jgi:hypothetical protein
MKKATVWTVENSDRICRCISIEKKTMMKTHLGILGLLSDDDNAANESSVASANKGGWTTMMFLEQGQS